MAIEEISDSFNEMYKPEHYGHKDYVDVKVEIIETGNKSDNI